MEIKEIEFENYGKCVQITNGIISAAVTIDFGPRIISFGFYGGENLLYTDPERKYAVAAGKDVPFGENSSAFYYYGGHRLWLNPRRPGQSIYPDNSAVVYSILPDGVAFLAPKQKTTDLQAGFEIIMGEDASDIMVVHTAKNCSKEEQTCGLWPITMVKPGGIVILPQNTDGSDLGHPNRSVVLWPETNIRDSRVFFGNRFITIRHEAGNEIPFKIGTNNVLGWMVYVCHDFTIMKRYVHTPQAVYPDFGCSSEVRLRSDFVELQSLSPLFRIESNAGIKHVENLSIFHTMNSVDPEDEDGIAKYVENLK